MHIYFRKQLEHELEMSYTGHEVIQEITNKEEALWLKCIDINDNWNAEVAVARDERLAKERETQREFILEQLVQKEEEKKQQFEAIEEIVRLEKVIHYNSCVLYVLIMSGDYSVLTFFLFRKNQKLI